MFFFTDFLEGGSKDFPVEQRSQLWQKVIELVDFIELLCSVEEAKLSFGFAHRGIVYRKGAKRREVSRNVLRHYQFLEVTIIPKKARGEDRRKWQ